MFDRLAAAQEAAAQHAEEEERRNRSGGVLGLGHLPYLGASSRSSFLGGGSGYGSGSPSTAAGMGSKRAASAAAAAAGHGPTSLFILTEKNIIRRYTRFIIEWPYPFPNELFSRNILLNYLVGQIVDEVHHSTQLDPLKWLTFI